MDRKAFLKYSSVIGIGAAIGAVKPISECVRFNRNLYKVTKSQTMMGTFATITVIDESPAQAEEAIALAFDEMKRVSRLLTRFDPGSAVGSLNLDGVLRDSPPEVVTVVQRAGYFHRLSGGVFDSTVAPLLNLYQENFDATGGPPSESSILEVLKRVDGNAVTLNQRSIRFVREGMAITLDGIAKGYVVDCGARVLRALHIEHGLINAGGDIRAIGGRNSRNPWKVAIQKPGQDRAFVDLVELNEGAIATSGNYEVYYDSEKLYHHIICPETGHSPHDASSVTVKSDTAMDADALSTTVFAMAPEKGIRFIDHLKARECLILKTDGKSLASSRWKSMLSPSRVRTANT